MKAKGILVLASVVTAIAAGCGPKKTTARVDLEYRVKPLKTLPEGYKRLGVYPIKTSGDATWSQAAARRLESRLQEIRDADKLDLEIVDQESFRQIQDQKEAMEAGLVEGDKAITAAKLKNVQAMITGVVDVKIDAHTTKKSTIDWASVAAGRHSGGGSVHTKEVEGVRRTITIDVSFKLIDGGTGKALDSMTKTYQETDKKEPSVFFGAGKTEGDLAPRDAIISNMIDSAVTDFLTRMFAYRFVVSVDIQSGKTEPSVRGVKLARAEDYAAAAEQFKASMAEQEDDPRTLFDYAVVLQKLGQYDAALKYYRQASAEDEEKKLYEDCRIRLERFKDRMAAPQQPSATQP